MACRVLGEFLYFTFDDQALAPWVLSDSKGGKSLR